MDRLYILRHGIAVPSGSPDFPDDDDRPLTKKGERRVLQIGHGLKHIGLKVDRIATSPLPRAFRTAEIVARVLGDPDMLETADPLKVNESAESIADWLATRSEVSLMIVGHNPSLSELVGLLASGEARSTLCDLRRGGMAAMVRRPEDTSRWAIDWIARPRLIRRLSDR